MQASTQAPSPVIRSVVSFLLFVHLFSLGISWLLWRQSSPVHRALRRFPGFYLQVLALDVCPDSGMLLDTQQGLINNPRLAPRAYRALWHLTHADALDVDHFLVFRTSGGQQRQWPGPGVWPDLRRLRYRMLAWEMARLAPIEDADSVLPAAVARGILLQHGWTRGELECRRLLLRSPQETRSNDPQLHDPYHPDRWETVYRAQVWLKNGQVLLRRTDTPEQRSGPVRSAPAAQAPQAAPRPEAPESSDQSLPVSPSE